MGQFEREEDRRKRNAKRDKWKTCNLLEYSYSIDSDVRPCGTDCRGEKRTDGIGNGKSDNSNNPTHPRIAET